MSLNPIELISFNLCPFVQRSVITLLKKGIDFKITYIDLANKPDWFVKISPMGKVPVLKYGGEILFESAVINEFLDEITPDRLLPEDALAKAKTRGWIEYCSQVIMSQFTTMGATTAEDYETQEVELGSKLARLENQVSENGYFEGGEFGLIDAAIAPVFTRFDVVRRHNGKDFLKGLPKLRNLSDKLAAQPFVRDSVIKDFDQVAIDFFNDRNSYLFGQPNLGS